MSHFLCDYQTNAWIRSCLRHFSSFLTLFASYLHTPKGTVHYLLYLKTAFTPRFFVILWSERLISRMVIWYFYKVKKYNWVARSSTVAYFFPNLSAMFNFYNHYCVPGWVFFTFSKLNYTVRAFIFDSK